MSFQSISGVIVHQGKEVEALSTKRQHEWIAKINRKNWKPKKYSRVCSLHFFDGKYTDTLHGIECTFYPGRPPAKLHKENH